MIISFAKTKKEFLSGNKTVTRRAWKTKHLKQWQKAWDEGRLIHQAWSKIPIAGGRFLAKIKLTCRPYLEKLSDMSSEDLLAEGGMCETLGEFCKLVDKSPSDTMAVIRFFKI